MATIPKQVIEMLGQVPLFSSCTKDQLRTIALQGTKLQMAEGRVLTRQGGLQEEFFLVLAGNAICLVDDEEVARFGPGDFFGEMTLLDRGPRTATIIATSPIDVLVLDRREFRTVVENAPGLAWKLLTGMAARLRAAQASHSH
jgi:CRP/FNR family cyclic AMP-dependent transcriptional regulator